MRTKNKHKNKHEHEHEHEKEIRDKSPKRNSPHILTEEELRISRQKSQERKDKFFNLVKDGDVKGVKEFLAPMNEPSKHLTVVNTDERNNTPLYYAAGFDTVQNGTKLNIEMIRLLMSTATYGFPQKRMHHGGSGKTNWDITAEHQSGTNLINVSGLTTENDDHELKVYHVSYNIDPNGVIQGYIKTPRPDVEIQLGSMCVIS